MTKAEERALEAYPKYISNSIDYTGHQRMIFQRGYEKAEKDLALTWQDIKTISRIIDKLVDEDIKGEIPDSWRDKEYFGEVLQRFNKIKGEQ